MIEITNADLETSPSDKGSETSSQPKTPPQSVMNQIGGFGINALKDVGQNIKGAYDLAKTAAGAVVDVDLLPVALALGQKPDISNLKSLGEGILQLPKGLEKKYYNPDPKNTLEAIFPSPTQIGKTFLQQPVSTLMDFSAGMGAIGKLGSLGKVAGLAGKVSEISDIPTQAMKGIGGIGSSRFADKIDPESLAAAKRQGITDLPATAVSQSRNVARIEKIATAGGGDALFNRVVNARKQLFNKANQFVLSYGDLNDVDKGVKISELQKSFKDIFNKTAQEMYANLDKERPNFYYMAAPQTVSEIDKMLEKYESAGVKLDPIKTTLEEVRELLDKPEGYSIKQLKDKIEYLNSKVNFQVKDVVQSGLNPKLEHIVDTLKNEEEKWLDRVAPTYSTAYQAVKSYYGQTKQLINSQVFKDVEKHIQAGNLSDVMGAVVNKRSSVEDIQRIQKVYGEQGMDIVRSTTIQDILGKAMDKNTGKISANSISNSLDTWGNDRLEEIFGKAGTDKLRDIHTLAKALDKTSKIQEGGGITTALMEGNLRGAIPAVMARLGTNKFISSPSGQKWLTTGLHLSDMPTYSDVTKLAPTVKYIKQAGGDNNQ